MIQLNSRQAIATIGFALMAGFSGAVLAQAYPTKPIKIIAPQAPGGATDTLARIVAQRLSERLGQPVIVENKAGANGGMGSGEAARAPGDGYTLLMANDGTHSINPALYKNITYDPIKDFVPVAIVGRVPFVLVTGAKSSFTSIDDVVTKSKIKQVTYGSAGNGSVNHLMATMVQSRTGANFQHIPYKGAAPALVDVVAGNVDVLWASLASIVPFVKSGQVRALAVTTAKRSPALPNVPAQAESALLSGFDVAPWFGLMAPAHTSPDIVNRLNAEVKQIVEQPEVRRMMETSGASPDYVTPAEYAKLVRDDLVRWAKVVKDSGAVIE